MKNLAAVLILFGSGLAAFGLSGFSGAIGTDTRAASFGLQTGLDGSFEWSLNQRIEIATGVIALAAGLLLRKDSS